MKIGRFTLTLLATASITLFAVSLAQAQLNRSWVASTGNDANTCDRANPCRTFQGALAKTNQQGEIDVIDTAEYGGGAPLVITKSVTIDGGGLGFILGGNATANDAVQVNTVDGHDVVTLRRISITGAHFGGVPSAQYDGIRFGTGGGGTTGALVVEHCQISNFSRAGINFTPDAGGQLFVRDSEFTNNEFFGIKIESTTSGKAAASIDNARLSNNGIFGTGNGISLRQRSQGTISGTTIAYNGLNGVEASPQAGNAEANLESTDVIGNNINLQSGFAAATATIRISNTDIFDATANGLAFTAGSSILSFGNNRIAGNIGSNGPPSGTLPQQ